MVASTRTVFPLVGRGAEMALLTTLLEAAEGGSGGTIFLVGEGGAGKTRLATAMSAVAERRQWAVANGRAYPVETGVPYAVFSDALVPILRSLDSSTLSLLTRGGSAELAYLFPALTLQERGAPVTKGEPAEFKARLLWNFAQFLGRYAAKRPLLIVLDNLQWADSSSLELLHFVARQISGEKLLIVCTYNEAERDQSPTLRTTEQSLVSMGAARVLRIEPLTLGATAELVSRVFEVEGAVVREFGALLYGWTRGNPFFIEETLKSLIESGKLYRREGTWLGWELERFELPSSVREAVIARLARLGSTARTVANLAAVVGTRASFDVLAQVIGMPRHELLAALDELRRQGLILESTETLSSHTSNGDAAVDVVVYDFAHPMIQQTLYSELGIARARLLHGTVAEALEHYYGGRALEHAGELAFHFSRADSSGQSPKAVKYLLAAGRHAVSKYANREAANYLKTALDLLSASDAPPADVIDGVVEDLARARQRLGEYAAAEELWRRARATAEAAGQHSRLAAIERRLGLAHYWSRRHAQALEHFDAGLEASRKAGDDAMYARLRLARGMALQEQGRHRDAQQEVEEALTIAERLGDESLLARVHRALLLLYLWTGPVGLAKKHGYRALALAEASGQTSVACLAHWALAILGGFTGNAAEIVEHLTASERLAEELRSPVLRVWTAEPAIEYMSGVGDWTAGLALAERAVSLARALGQKMVLPRLLVWTGMMHIGRGDLERARECMDEAWQLGGPARSADRPMDVHTVVPVYTGLAAYHLACGDYAQAISTGEKGLAIADRTGYIAWAIHRLLPVIAEAALHARDLDRAQQIGERLRHESQKLGHRLGMAWADACDALVLRQRGDNEAAIEKLAAAADELEAIPYVWDAARLRRQLARALLDRGDREGATRELRRAFDVFTRLGAERDLDATREQLRELGARPPARPSAAGVDGLTAREVEIIRLVAARRSNKEIGKALGISPRTVSTHLSNIFQKLEIGSRGELADYARRNELPARLTGAAG